MSFSIFVFTLGTFSSAAVSLFYERTRNRNKTIPLRSNIETLKPKDCQFTSGCASGIVFIAGFLLTAAILLSVSITRSCSPRVSNHLIDSSVSLCTRTRGKLLRPYPAGKRFLIIYYQIYDKKSSAGTLDNCNNSLQSFTWLAIIATSTPPIGRKHSRIE